MPFLFNIPQASDQLSLSQGDLLNNMGILGAIAGNASANSASLNATTGFNFVNFALPGLAATTAANQMALYTGNYANSTKQELFIVRQNSTGRIPTTAARVSVQNPAGFAGQSTGWTYLPSGCLMVWGNGTTGGSTNVLITYSSVAGFPGFTVGAVPLVTRLETAATTTTFLFVQTTTLTNFTIRTATGNINAQFTWFAIGQ